MCAKILVNVIAVSVMAGARNAMAKVVMNVTKLAIANCAKGRENVKNAHSN